MSKKIILITCTYKRPGRINCLQRCIRTFRTIKNVIWIVVEDSRTLDDKIKHMLKKSKISHVYLCAGPTNDLGHEQRNMALTYIRDKNIKGIVYNADDDNFYKRRLFNEIEKTKKMSVFPVGNLGPRNIERPIVKDNKIISWDSGWKTRKFPVDMAGFAFDSALLSSLKNPLWNHKGRGGETEFIEKSINSSDELEFLCDNCMKCYVWHNEPLFFGKSITSITRKLKKLKKFLSNIYHINL